MAVTETYVRSVNGKTGDLPYELDRIEPIDEEDREQIFGQVTHKHRNLWLDANDFHIIGETGSTIPQKIQSLASNMRPLLLERIEDTNDYVMKVGTGIPYEPVAK